MQNRLYRSGAGADRAHALFGKAGETTADVASRIRRSFQRLVWKVLPWKV